MFQGGGFWYEQCVVAWNKCHDPFHYGLVRNAWVDCLPKLWSNQLKQREATRRMKWQWKINAFIRPLSVCRKKCKCFFCPSYPAVALAVGIQSSKSELLVVRTSWQSRPLRPRKKQAASRLQAETLKVLVYGVLFSAVIERPRDFIVQLLIRRLCKKLNDLRVCVCITSLH